MTYIQPLVSVIIPTYNGAKRIAKTLEAIINQDYENIEIILVDDVSTDDTVKISQEILEKGGRKFFIIKRTVNGRQSASRNTGLKAAKGKYVIFIDHDDLMDKNFVSLLLNEAENKNADMVFCGFRHYYEEENRYDYNYVLLKYPLSYPETPEKYLRAWAEKKTFFSGAWNCIFKKNFLERTNLHFYEKCHMCEDIEFITKALALSSSISYVRATPYIYIHHSGQKSTTEPFNHKTYPMYLLAMLRAGRCVIRNTKDKYVRDYTLSYCIAHRLIRHCKFCADAGDREYYERIVKTLHHKTIRSVMLSTVKFVFKDPELFFNSLALIYFPDLFYRIRSKK